MIRVVLGAGDSEIRLRLERLLNLAGLETDAVEAMGPLWEKLARGDYDLLVVERGLLPPRPDAALASLRTLPEHPAVIVVSREDIPKERAELLSAGCLAVLWLGLEDEILGETLASLARRQGDEVLERLGAERPQRRSMLDDFTSESPSMQRFLRLAHRVVKGSSALLILGETGVGKERLARSIHSESDRASGPFITVNCGALPESLLESELFGHEEGAFTGAIRARRGYFELAHRGTILLDEIGEMPLHLQVKLLRVLEDRSIRRVGSERPVQVDVRVMAATNRDLKQDVDAGRFRPDLYYRLAVVTLEVPPLRERREDIPELARGFLEKSRRQLGKPVTRIQPEAMDALVRHDWPGNVRELINVIERAVLLAPGPEIRIRDFRGEESWTRTDSGSEPVPGSGSGSASGDDPEGDASLALHLDEPLARARARWISAFEKRYLRELLARTVGRVGEAARLAGLNERTLYTLMRRHRLRKEDFKSAGAPELHRTAHAPRGSR
jgi:DNA-binding NtrC family response regulator